MLPDHPDHKVTLERWELPEQPAQLALPAQRPGRGLLLSLPLLLLGQMLTPRVRRLAPHQPPGLA